MDAGVIAEIPSPGSNSLNIGPLSLNAYGLMIALGVIAAVWMFGRRLEERSLAKRDVASQIGVWSVIAGVVGARLYHVITDWDRFDDDLAEIPKIWEGGLGIPGGLLAGVAVGIWVARRHGLSAADAATCAAPALPLAQAIGRWGNWFNQELFGRPSDLPWALEIDADHLPAGYAPGTTFHPAFLYESLWNLALCGVVLWIDRRWSIRRGGLLAVYVAGYGIGRLWIEGLRIDPADEFGGLRLNQWVALLAIVGGAGYLVWVYRNGGLSRRDDTVPAVAEPPESERSVVDGSP
jgi:prolipoprotein diacylglyceryl transferase